jgi:hypothetical protein
MNIIRKSPRFVFVNLLAVLTAEEERIFYRLKRTVLSFSFLKDARKKHLKSFIIKVLLLAIK